jgi:hypothetical protein
MEPSMNSTPITSVAGVLAKKSRPDPFAFVGGPATVPFPVTIAPEPSIEVGASAELTLSVIPADDGSDGIDEIDDDFELRIGDQTFELTSAAPGAVAHEFRVSATRLS